MKVVSYRHQGKPGIGVVVGEKGVIALANAAPALPNDLRRILQIDPTLARVRAATEGKSADLTLDDIAFDPVIREPHATWALALNYKLHIEETGLDHLARSIRRFSCACRSVRSAITAAVGAQPQNCAKPTITKASLR